MIDFREQQWIQAAKSGDADAFGALIKLYEKQVFALTMRMCRNPQDAVEAAQEAFLSAWQALPSFRGESSFSTWLYRLVCNACTDLLRRESRHRSRAAVSLDDENAAFSFADSSCSPQEEAERSELRALIEEALQALTPEHRQILILREIHQQSYDEISHILSLDLGTVKSRISRARKELREILLKSGNFHEFHPSKQIEKEGCN